MILFNEIKDYLYHNNYFINITDKYIHIYNFTKIIILNDKELLLNFNNFNLKIEGINLKVIQLLNKEMKLIGNINNIGYEK